MCVAGEWVGLGEWVRAYVVGGLFHHEVCVCYCPCCAVCCDETARTHVPYSPGCRHWLWDDAGPHSCLRLPGLHQVRDQ